MTLFECRDGLAPNVMASHVVGEVVVGYDAPGVGDVECEDWFRFEHKRLFVGKVLVTIHRRLSNVASFLTALAHSHEPEAAADEDEFESRGELLVQLPTLMNDFRFAFYRTIYTLEPLYIARHAFINLARWKSKPASVTALFLIEYIIFADKVVPAVALGFW